MIQPLNRLPWELYDSSGYITINSPEPNLDDCVCQDLYSNDAEYLVQACNNFPKSIELLKECARFMNTVPNDKEGINHYEILKRVDEFLKEIE